MKREDAVALVAGLLFGLGLVISGMTLPTKVVGFFDLSGDWDPSLALVMVGAIAVYMPAYRYIVRRASPLYARGFFLPVRKGVDARLLVGAVLFGLGWIGGGFCPGPAIVSAGGRTESGLLFAAGMLGGFVLFALGERAARRRRATAPRADELPIEAPGTCAG